MPIKELFPMLSVGREDLADLGFDTSDLSDDDMEKIAKLATSGLLEGAYWEAIEAAAIARGLKQD